MMEVSTKMSDEGWIEVKSKKKRRSENANSNQSQYSSGNTSRQSSAYDSEIQNRDPVFLKGKANTKQPHTKTIKKSQNPSVSQSGVPSWKVERMAEEGSLVKKSVSHNTSLEIQRARQRMKLTQKDLAKKVNIPLHVVQGYENGTVIPNGQELNRLSQALDVKLKS